MDSTVPSLPAENNHEHWTELYIIKIIILGRLENQKHSIRFEIEADI